MDTDRIISKIAETEQTLAELREIQPTTITEYKHNIEKRRACERLLQISIETILDTCALLEKQTRSGLPNNENDILERLKEKNILPKDTIELIKEIKSVRNILVHKYGRVDDDLIYDDLQHLSDFDKILQDIKQRIFAKDL